MILAVDVHYEENHAIIAGVLFEDWQASTPVKEVVSYIEEIAPYEPGGFYKRELPCIGCTPDITFQTRENDG